MVERLVLLLPWLDFEVLIGGGLAELLALRFGQDVTVAFHERLM